MAEIGLTAPDIARQVTGLVARLDRRLRARGAGRGRPATDPASPTARADRLLRVVRPFHRWRRARACPGGTRPQVLRWPTAVRAARAGQPGGTPMDSPTRQPDPPTRNVLLRTKSVEQSIRDTEEPEHALRKSLSALDLTVFGVGVIIGTGIFVLTGQVAKDNAGPAVALVLRRRRRRLRAGRPVLRGVRLHGAGRRIRVHLLLRLARRAARLDHRLGPGPGTRARRGGGGRRLVGLHPLAAGQRRAAPAAGAVRHQRLGRLRLRPAGLPAGAAAHRGAGRRDEAVRAGHLADRRDQGRRGAAGDLRRAVLHQGRQLPPLHPARRSRRAPGSGLQGAAGPADVRLRPDDLRRSGASSPPPPWSSSPSSASTSSRPPPRRPGGRSGTCRAASSARSLICTVLYVAVSVVVTGMQKYTQLSVDAPLADAFKATGAPFWAGTSSASAPRSASPRSA